MKYDLRNKTDEELISYIHKNNPWSDLHIAAKAEYEKRIRKRDFWSKGIVAWLALGVSIISLVISIIALYKK